MDERELKRKAAEKAVESVHSGMVLGLGGGTTAAMAIECIGELLEQGELEDIYGVPCSTRVEARAREHGVPLTSLEDEPTLDLTIDGADEVDKDLNLIKGGGGALVWEKIVAQVSRREIIVVDESKLSPVVGKEEPVPAEVLYFGLRTQRAFLEEMGADTNIRTTYNGTRYVSDNGNYIVDCDFGAIDEPRKLADEIKLRPGIIDHGLFVDYADEVIVAGEKGIRHMHRERHGERRRPMERSSK